MNLSTAELLQQMIDIKKDMRTAIGDKGVTVVSGMESYPSAIDSIQQEVYVGNSKLTNGMRFHGSFTECPMFDTSEMTTMKEMFRLCYYLTTVPSFNTSNVTDMNSMFYDCRKLTSIGQFDTSKVTDMNFMFYDCYELPSVPTLDCSSATTTQHMFFECRALTTAPQLLNTGNVTNMGAMFANCDTLTTVPQFDTSKVITMVGMFADCYKLTTIPLLDCSSIDYIYATSTNGFENVFADCASLTNIGGFKNLGKTYMHLWVQLHASRKITNESWTNIFNNLWDRSRGYGSYTSRITINNDIINNIPDDIKAIATSKGWTLEGYKYG